MVSWILRQHCLISIDTHELGSVVEKFNILTDKPA